ncbi:MAG: aminotransferase class I/II-fold pyridoxal phosphate-dependent enzyme [Methanocellales archaeon]|nr:aminotransferase class I/II-fold pyridoxal phosphate-dependent enzyme [Methanocellales archaeon]MDD4898530.1 aminotransferase class I/II-fold pyridoxal phosphate-dependent enzyme [Methanocellales archaeon]
MIADKVKRIPPSGIRKYFEMTLGMEDIISLGVGEPDFVTPWSIREACIYALEKGYTSYTSNWGLLELRNEISSCIASDYKVRYNPENQIIVTTGVSEAFDLAIRAIVNPGDEVIIAEPCYVSYKPCVILAGGKPVVVSADLCNDFKAIPEHIGEKITPKTKAIILSYPNNPTGAIMGKKDLEGIADIVKDHDLFVISDEVYDKLTYDGTHTCFSSLDGMYDKTILLNGFSKAYAMTGWRLGYAASNQEVIAAMLKIHQYTMLCAPITAQMAAIEALRNGREEMLSMVREYDRRRRLIVKGLSDLGLDCFEPKGAFYAFPSVESTGMTSEVFAEKLLKEQKVAVVPGDVFGDSGEGFIRCAYAVSRRDIKEALERIGEFLK